MALAAISGSSVQRMPPSPLDKALLDWVLKQAIWPNLPIGVPLQVMHRACAQSSIRQRSYFLQILTTSSIWGMCPRM